MPDSQKYGFLLTPGDLSDQLNWKHRLLPRRLSLKDDSSAGRKISLDTHLDLAWHI
jgi:hypothetical protein